MISRDKQREYQKRYRDKYPDKIKDQHKRHRAKHRETINARNKKRREADPDYYRNWHLQKRYGISLEEYNKLFAQQNGCCAICRTSALQVDRAFDVDHDHTTGAVRGLLCSLCNNGLGAFRDSTAFLHEAINYLLRS